MNIDGTNTLACTRGAYEVKKDTITNLSAAASAGDQGSGPDLTNFYAASMPRRSHGCRT